MVSLFVIAGTGAASAQGTSSQGQQAAGSPITGLVRGGSYRIQPGDMITFRVWPNAVPEIAGDFPVEGAGVVYLPMLGAVTVGGKTLDDVRGMLRDMYSKVVQGSTQPVVTITARFPFSVIGGVVMGGVFEGQAGMTVFDAISRAGGFRSDTRPKYLDVIHADGTTTRLDTESSTGATLAAVLLQSQDRVVVPVTKRLLSSQNLYTFVQIALGVVTVIKLFGK